MAQLAAHTNQEVLLLNIFNSVQKLEYITPQATTVTTVSYSDTTMALAIAAADAGLAALTTKRVIHFSSLWDGTKFYLTYTLVNK